VQPYVVLDNKKTPSLFFIGAQSSLLAVSRAGIISGEFPEIFRLSSLEKENGLFDLIYQAKSTEQFLLLGTEQTINFDKQLTLFTDLDRINFNYFGWSSLNVKSNNNASGAKAQWYERFSGIDNQLIPEKFSIELIKNKQVLAFPVDLEDNSERWLSPYMGDSG
jgi:hypothetical protein